MDRGSIAGCKTPDSQTFVTIRAIEHYTPGISGIYTIIQGIGKIRDGEDKTDTTRAGRYREGSCRLSRDTNLKGAAVFAVVIIPVMIGDYVNAGIYRIEKAIGGNMGSCPISEAIRTGSRASGQLLADILTNDKVLSGFHHRQGVHDQCDGVFMGTIIGVRAGHYVNKGVHDRRGGYHYRTAGCIEVVLWRPRETYRAGCREGSGLPKTNLRLLRNGSNRRECINDNRNGVFIRTSGDKIRHNQGISPAVQRGGIRDGRVCKR